MENVVLGWGIPLTPKLRNLFARLAKEGASSALMLQALRKTKDYAQHFPGLIRKDGTPRMSEAQYLSGYNSAKDYAASVGRTLNKAAYGMALKNGNSPSEIKAKIQATDLMKEHGATLKEFSDYLVATGQTKRPLNRQELQQFVMKQGPKAWTDAWEMAQQASALSNLGIDVGKPASGSDVSYKELNKLQAQMQPGAEVDYQGISATLSALPASQLYQMGLTKKDALTVGYGGKGAATVLQRVKATMATQSERFAQEPANLRLNPGGGKTTGMVAQSTE